MKKNIILLLTALTSLVWSACEKDEPNMGGPPSLADAAFTYIATTESENIIEFTANSSDAISVWDFGNGTSAKGTKVKGIYPNKGVYIVIHTLYTKGGSQKTRQDVTIKDDDFSLLDNPVYTLLTGGVNDSTDGKTWVIDSSRQGHFGVGPNPSSAAFGDFPEYYDAGPNEKAGSGFYNDRYVFKLDGFKYDQITKGDVYVNSANISNFPGSVQGPAGDYVAPFPSQLGKTWNLSFGEDTILSVSGNSFIGYATGVSSYKIVSLSENEMFLRQLDANNADLAWYLRLIPEGYVPTGPPAVDARLPIDFENVEPNFVAFGNSTATVEDNHDVRGINTSSRVLKTEHGDETWAGISVELANKLDFTTNKKIALKVWAPTTGVFRIKLEDKNDSSVFTEQDVNVAPAFTWIEIAVDFSSTTSGTYDKLVLFPGWNVSNAGTFYIDDIQQK